MGPQNSPPTALHRVYISDSLGQHTAWLALNENAEGLGPGKGKLSEAGQGEAQAVQEDVMLLHSLGTTGGIRAAHSPRHALPLLSEHTSTKQGWSWLIKTAGEQRKMQLPSAEGKRAAPSPGNPHQRAMLCRTIGGSLETLPVRTNTRLSALSNSRDRGESSAQGRASRRVVLQSALTAWTRSAHGRAAAHCAL